ncbi:LOW QUALITY PROTEIN: uncharacterized protein B0I36DRAFT_371329 [Microdochium trichocladiopsis]|uniref:NACHT domain-containing protein n=1 Tax=Microdochium trichocladiopsis TaxID=1682393 RepID=A0A9P9BWS0_9PEZI|nr:LOW QUALITY PROTEIN: uncharacterized protein B0I36DRAFT_371329 [Microdochium trichocladiopsis]KAH7040875.1 LOW QUALITY PROTEIN: hypothetical protein B0I36DRAFT_371329 [Microdochium trichocladiopsis]
MAKIHFLFSEIHLPEKPCWTKMEEWSADARMLVYQLWEHEDLQVGQKHMHRVRSADYTIAWICALHLELAASRLMLDEEHPALGAYEDDHNVYVLGRIAAHNVVMTALPVVYGKVNAALVATHLRRTFPNIRATLMVGIGGGAPSEADLYLGDVVVVMEYDLGKAMGDGLFEITAKDKHPSSLLRGAHGLEKWSPRAQELLRTRLSQYCRPTQPDRLFQASYSHPTDTKTCDECDSTRLQTRRRRNFHVHYGGVASGDSVNKDAQKRDALDIICFEMEAAGMMDSLQCLPIRDSHKNKEWQEYAAATAASYARELLETIPSNIRKDAIRPEQGKTCRWFLAHPKYVFWTDLSRNTETSSLLWLRGKAGAGKSTLIKFLYLESKRKQKDATVISFFFNARGDTLEKSIAGMYRSILWQSVLGDPEIDPAKYELACPDLDSLKNLLTSALGNRPLLCFIDALDECNEEDARDIVDYFESLVETAQEEGIKLRVAFSSRPYPYIHIEEKNEAGHAQDLAQYVKKCLKPRAELEGRILEKASGVFMWVVLVVGILNKEASRGGLALRKRLLEIPPTLSQLFKDILTRDQERPQELRRCILWRPLSPGEFCHAMWAGGLATGDIPDATDDESIVVLATSTSKGLVEIVSTKKKQATVQFIHESVRDFLVKGRGLQELWPDLGFDWEGTSHELLRSDCEAYLRRWRVLTIAKSHPPRPHESLVLMEYATQSILLHADEAAPSTSQKDFLVRFFGQFDAPTLDLYQPVKARRFGKYPSPLQILATLGTSKLIRLHRETIDSISDSSEHRTYHPLLIAMSRGHKDTVAALLGLSTIIHEGVDPMEGLQVGANFKHFYRRSPMTWAAQQGRCALISLLAANGVSVQEKDALGLTPLERATEEGRVQALRVLVGLGVSDTDLWKAISSVVRSADEGTAMFLLRHLEGWQIRLVSYRRDSGMWLFHAARRGFVDAVRLLLQHGAVDRDRNASAIAAAAQDGHLQVVGLLANSGASLETVGGWYGWTALMNASARGHLSVVEFLIGRGANLHITNRDGESALHLAVQNGHDLIAQRLRRALDIQANEEGNQPSK